MEEYNLIFKKVMTYTKTIKAKDFEKAEKKALEILEKQNECEDSQWHDHAECDGWDLDEVEEV